MNQWRYSIDEPMPDYQSNQLNTNAKRRSLDTLFCFNVKPEIEIELSTLKTRYNESEGTNDFVL
jgi:hypothetical protein